VNCVQGQCPTGNIRREPSIIGGIRGGAAAAPFGVKQSELRLPPPAALAGHKNVLTEHIPCRRVVPVRDEPPGRARCVPASSLRISPLRFEQHKPEQLVAK